MAAGSSRRPPRRRRRRSRRPPPRAPRGPAAPLPPAGRARPSCCWRCWRCGRSGWGPSARATSPPRALSRTASRPTCPPSGAASRRPTGADLAIDRLAVNVTATPYLVDRSQGAPPPSSGRSSSATPTSSPTPSRSPAATSCWRATCPPATADRAKKLDLAGHRLLRHLAALLPGRLAGGPAARVDRRHPRGHLGHGAPARHGPCTGTPGHRLEVRDLLGNSIQVLQDREPVRAARTSS